MGLLPNYPWGCSQEIRVIVLLDGQQEPQLIGLFGVNGTPVTLTPATLQPVGLRFCALPNRTNMKNIAILNDL